MKTFHAIRALQRPVPRLVSGVNSLVRILRVVSLCEGVSFLVLLLVAMPLKYLMGIPEAVRYTGWAHGLLFIVLCALILAALNRGSISFRTAVMAGIAALLPGGPFLMDRTLRALEDRETE